MCPQLEYGMPAYSPNFVADINNLERIQRLSQAHTQGHNGVTVSYEFIDLWTEVREWSVRPV